MLAIYLEYVSFFYKMANMATTERVYSEAEVEARLKQDLPHWFLKDGWIRRKYKTSGWKGTLQRPEPAGTDQI